MKHKTNKKAALELSMNFIVVIIISIVIFAFGIRFVYNMFSNSNKMADSTMASLDKQLAQMSCGNTEKVCILKDTIDIKAKETVVTGVQILNTDAKGDFRIGITEVKYLDLQGNEKTPGSTGYPTGKVTFFPTVRPAFEIDKNIQCEPKAIQFTVASGAPKGTYIFNVEVYKDMAIGAGPQYDNQIHKIWVNVK